MINIPYLCLRESVLVALGTATSVLAELIRMTSVIETTIVSSYSPSERLEILQRKGGERLWWHNPPKKVS